LANLGRWRKFIAAVVTLIALVILMSVTVRERQAILFIEKAVVEAFAPVQAWASGLTAGVRGGLADLQAVSRLRQENEALRLKADAYDSTLHQLRELEIENERLRSLLGFTQSIRYSYVVADVIARNADNWFSRLTIDRGLSDGLAKDMPVVTSQGLVGRIVEVSNHVSIVQLLTDRDSGAGALIQSSRDAGIVSGQGNESPLLVMMLFERNAAVGVGDVVVTSGFGEIFPSGLHIGVTVEVAKDSYGLLKYAKIRPAVDYGRLQEVLVITNAGSVAIPDAGG
jgi:rod shape-determining protein MreC